jgi:hypothetical protein
MTMTAAVPTITVSYGGEVSHFDRLKPAKANEVVFELIDMCKQQRIYLTDRGNVGSTWTVQQYYTSTPSDLFRSVAKIQAAFKFLRTHVQHSEDGVIKSREFYKTQDFRAGECMAAMMLLGYDARFKIINDMTTTQCEFPNAEWINP